MSLVDVELAISRDAISDEIAEFLEEADARVKDYLDNSRTRVSGFIPSDSETAFHALRAIVDANIAPGDLFCEWGSGFGVVTSLAALLGFQSYGIETDGNLVAAARRLAEDFDIEAEFVQGSFIPHGSEEEAECDFSTESFWLVTDVDDAYSELDVGPEDFDVIYGYPWPNEESPIARLFHHVAADGALLLTYNQLDEVRVRRKQLNEWAK